MNIAEKIDEILKGCEHDGSFIPVSEVISLMLEMHDKTLDDVENKIKKLDLTYDDDGIQLLHRDWVFDEIKELRQ